jgi:DNA double-strand break repair helicase HerA and related ATPase
MAKRKTPPTEDASSGGATETTPADSVYLGKGTKSESICLRFANRHGLSTGATGTGTTATPQGLAECFSDQGVPVFCADVNSDLSEGSP